MLPLVSEEDNWVWGTGKNVSGLATYALGHWHLYLLFTVQGYVPLPLYSLPTKTKNGISY